jgi:hypothetical protein
LWQKLVEIVVFLHGAHVTFRAAILGQGTSSVFRHSQFQYRQEYGPP